MEEEEDEEAKAEEEEDEGKVQVGAVPHALPGGWTVVTSASILNFVFQGFNRLV